MKAESIEKGRSRWYPCPKCQGVHPSITTILDVIGSPALMGWMAKNGVAKLNVLDGIIKDALSPTKEGLGIYEKVRSMAEFHWRLKEDTAFWKSGKEVGSDAADIGTLCHAWIEAHLQGKEITLESLPPQARNAIESYLEWEGEHKLETIGTEQTFYNCRLNYAGTADWIGRLDGELAVGDWKTSSGIFFNYAIQLWGYALADETQNAERLYGKTFAGRFGKDGASEVRIFKRNEFPGIEVARDVLVSCGHIFSALEKWNEAFPYKRKEKLNGKGAKHVPEAKVQEGV